MTVEANAVVRTTARCWQLCGDGDVERATALLHPDFVHDDRRRGLTNKLTNRDDTIANNCTFVELGFSIELFPIVVRGDRLALCRAMLTDTGGNEIVALQVLALDERGLRTACVSFDEEDVAAATSELDARHRRQQLPPDPGS